MKILEALWRGRVERNELGMIVRHVKVDRAKTRQQMIAALVARGCEEYVNNDVLETMPTQGMEEEDVYLFPVKRAVLVEEYAYEFESRLLEIDPYAQIQANIDDPFLSDEHPNGVQWVDKYGNFCYAAISRWRGGRAVVVDRDDRRWLGSGWIGGVLATPRPVFIFNQLGV